jgi:hypothetical protein
MRSKWILLLLFLIACTPPNSLPVISKPLDKTLEHNTLANPQALEISFTVSDQEDAPEALITSASFDKPEVVTALAPISCVVKTCKLSLRVDLKKTSSVKVSLNVRDKGGAKAETSFNIIIAPRTVTATTEAALRTLLEQAKPGESLRLSTATSQTLKLSDQILIDKELTLWGMGQDKTILDAQALNRHFWIKPGAKFTLNDLTLTNGLAKDDGSTLADEPLGGAIFNESILTLERVRIIKSRAVRGGGVFNLESGTLNVLESVIGQKNASNVATRSGGGLFNDSGKMNVLKSQISFNQGVERGGGIYNHLNGALVVEESTFDGNISWDGTAIKNDNAQIGTASTIIRKSTIKNHQASQFEGGGIFNRGRLELYDSTVSNNSTLLGEGGGIYSLGATSVVILDHTTLSNNSGAANGGGINNTSASSTLIIRNGSQITGNKSKRTGGGIFNEGKLTITADCQVTGNTANTSNKGFVGGGLYNTGALVNTTTATLTAVIKDNQPNNFVLATPPTVVLKY